MLVWSTISAFLSLDGNEPPERLGFAPLSLTAIEAPSPVCFEAVMAMLQLCIPKAR